MPEIKNKKKINFFIKALIFTFIAFCVITILTQLIQFDRLQNEISVLGDSIYDAEQVNEELREELDRPIDDQYIMSIARLKLRYHLPEEIIFYHDLITKK